LDTEEPIVTVASQSAVEGIEYTLHRPEAPAVSERVLVVLPTYNERKNLPLIVPAILGQDSRLEILVVDDNSPDGTGELADEMAAADRRIHVLHREVKEGLGRAYLAGFAWALQRDFDLVFEMDADFSHDPRFLLDFLRAIEDGADLVVGSRYKRGVNVINWPMSRLLLSYGANLYARFVTGLPLTDSTGGFKCFRRRVLQAIDFGQVRSNGYAFQIEMSYRAWNKGFQISEIPIVFVDRVEGQSKMSKRIVREAIWMVWWLRCLAIARRL
jgi:dolichol-phosphate mannosyltransferase